VTQSVNDSTATGDLNDVYREVCAGVRFTDDISLKLLAAVPLATGIGITLLAQAPSARLPNGVRALLSLFAAVITFAIYRWERKNLATCAHFREWAAVLERDYFKGHPWLGEEGAPGSPPHGEVSDPKFLGMSWGKTEAASLLYRTAILSWLSAAAYALTT